MGLKFEKANNCIKILTWANSAYDHDEGYFEIASIKMSKSGNSYMNDWDLDEVLATLESNQNGVDGYNKAVIHERCRLVP